jgi:mannose-6-phosphate isomerase-like protein (cupin superfamily)
MGSTKAIDLGEVYMHVQPGGTVDVVPKSTGATQSGDDTVVWDPQLDGVLVGQADVSSSSRHRGERHLDGDEVVYLVSGSATLSMADDDTTREVVLQPGEAVVVPQGVWHRLLIEEPSRLLFFSTGRTEVRPPSR